MEYDPENERERCLMEYAWRRGRRDALENVNGYGTRNPYAEPLKDDPHLKAVIEKDMMEPDRNPVPVPDDIPFRDPAEE